MRTTIKLTLSILLLLSMTSVLYGQGSSLNYFSPYSFYGFGNLSEQGSTSIRSMGGAGVASRNSRVTNYLNPASYGAIGERCTLFSINTEGQYYHLKDANTSSSFNTFNIRDISMHLPLGKGIGFAFSITPYSSVGYRIRNTQDTKLNASDVGYIKNLYDGSGNMNQIKGGVGYDIIPGKLSLGAELVYYHGKINRTYHSIFYPLISTGTFTSVYGYDTETINTFLANFGAQAALINKDGKLLILGATYRMGGKMNGKSVVETPYQPVGLEGLGVNDTIRYHSSALAIKMPHTVTLGVNYYNGKRLTLSADYSFSSWGSSNQLYSNDKYGFRNTHSVMAGMEFIPNAGDVRNYFNKCAYRFGLRYTDFYMVINGEKIADKAISFGMEFPLDQRRRNAIDVGIELGSRGKSSDNLIRENYVKFSIGFNLFGSDYWFTKVKYN